MKGWGVAEQEQVQRRAVARHRRRRMARWARWAVRWLRHPRYAVRVAAVLLHRTDLVRTALRVGWRPALLGECERRCPALRGLITPYEAGFFGQVYLFDEYEVGALPLPEEAVVIDAGANVGFFSWRVHDHRPRARVYACEPQSDNVRRLQALFSALAIPGRVVPEALGGAEGEATLYLHNSVTHSLDPTWHAELGQGASEPVPVTTVDALCRREGLDRIDLLKIDVEGAELAVLQGSADMLPRTRYVVLEYHGRELGRRCRELLRAQGFRCRRKSFWGLGDGRQEEGLLICRRVRSPDGGR